MDPSSEESASSAGSVDSNELDLDSQSIGALSVLDNFLHSLEDFPGTVETNLDPSRLHSASEEDLPPSPDGLQGEGLPGGDAEHSTTGLYGSPPENADAPAEAQEEQAMLEPNILSLARMHRHMIESRRGMAIVSLQDSANLIRTQFVPFLRHRGYLGATADDVAQNFLSNPSFFAQSDQTESQTHPAPIAPRPGDKREASWTSSLSDEASSWKIKNRPTYASGLKPYQKRKASTKKKETKGVSALNCVYVYTDWKEDFVFGN